MFNIYIIHIFTEYLLCIMSISLPNAINSAPHSSEARTKNTIVLCEIHSLI